MAQGEEGNEPSDSELQLALRRYELAKLFVPAVWIAALYLPIRAAIPIAEALAGEDTNLTLTISITFVFTLALGGGVAALLRKTHEQRNEIQRLRERVEELEEELGV